MNYTFTGNRDVDNVLLTSLNAYDLYNTCQTSKTMFALCQQNPTLYQKYLHVKNILNVIEYVVKNRKFVYINEISFDVNLKSILPMLNNNFNFVYPIGSISVDIIRNHDLIEFNSYKGDYMKVGIYIDNLQLIDCLVRLSLISQEVFEFMLIIFNKEKKPRSRSPPRKKKSIKKKY